MKKVFGGLAILIAIIAIALTLAIGNLDKIVKEVVETVGTKVLKTPVTLEKVTVELTDGYADLQGLSIANLPGFSSTPLFAMNKTAVGIDLKSLSTDHIILNQVTLSGVAIQVEEVNGKINVDQLRRQLNQATSSAQSSSQPSSSEAAPQEAQPSSEPQIKLGIRRLEFSDNKATLESKQFGTLDLKLPTLVETNIGTDNGGLTPEALTQELMDRILKKVERAAKKAVEDKAKEKAKEKLHEEKQRLMDKHLNEDEQKAVKQFESLFKK